MGNGLCCLETVKPELVIAVERFRRALEVGVLLHLVQFEAFPAGACGDTCLLLARWLEANGFGCWEYVTGWRDRWSLAWLQQAGVIVDVTADQFPDMKQPVIVSTDDAWHRHFNGQATKLEAFGPDDPLNDAYAKLEEALSH